LVLALDKGLSFWQSLLPALYLYEYEVY